MSKNIWNILKRKFTASVLGLILGIVCITVPEIGEKVFPRIKAKNAHKAQIHQYWQHMESKKSVVSQLAPYAPTSNLLGMPLQNMGYISYFSKAHNIPIWVGYLVKYPFKYGNGERPDSFEPDYRVPSSPEHSDYTNTGYDRGHMAPNYAISRTFGIHAQKETFLMTNVAPQLPSLNRKQWCDLEQWIANTLSKRYGKVIVFVGPVITDSMKKLKNKISVPSSFWMVVFAQGTEGVVGCGFVIPQTPNTRDFYNYVVTVDQVEKMTGLNFLPKLEQELQEKIEGKISISK